MTSKTVVQYTPEQTSTLIAEYTAGASVEAIATAMGKSVRSVIAVSYTHLTLPTNREV